MTVWAKRKAVVRLVVAADVEVPNAAGKVDLTPMTFRRAKRSRATSRKHVAKRLAGGLMFSVMTNSRSTYLDVGMYTVPEAARLTGVSKERIRRWLKGYRSNLRKKNYSALWKPQLPQQEQKVVLGFLDLIEIKFVGTFLDRGVSWPMIHRVREKAADLFPGVSHPFCTKAFVTDGQRVFMAVHKETGDGSLLDIATDQHVFAEITRPFLKELEFRHGSTLERWWPLGQERQVVVDPRKNFGQPTIYREGIATQVLAEGVKANGSLEVVARWYEISVESVQEAVEYERSLAA